MSAYPHFVVQPAVCCIFTSHPWDFPRFCKSALGGPALKSDFCSAFQCKRRLNERGMCFDRRVCQSNIRHLILCANTSSARTRSLAALTEDRHGRSVRAGWLVSGCLRCHWDGWLFDRAIRPASHRACLGRPETLCVYTFYPHSFRESFSFSQTCTNVKLSIVLGFFSLLQTGSISYPVLRVWIQPNLHGTTDKTIIFQWQILISR